MAHRSEINGQKTDGKAAAPAGDQFAISVKQACCLTTLGRSTLYEAMADGRLLFFKSGARTLIRPDDLRAFLQNEAERRSEGA